MKDISEYLRGEIEKYRDVLDEADEYGEGGAYHYYEGRADAYEDMLEMMGKGMRKEVTNPPHPVEDLISKLKSIRYYAGRVPGKYLGGECVGLCNRVRSLKSSVKDLEDALKSMGYLDSGSTDKGMEDLKRDVMLGFYLSKYYSILFLTCLNGCESDSHNILESSQIFVNGLNGIIERLEKKVNKGVRGNEEEDGGREMG